MTEYRDNPGIGDALGGGDDAEWARTVDAVFLAVAKDGATDERPLSSSLRERLEREGAAGGGAASAPAQGPVARLGWLSWAGWAAAAAIGLAFLVFGPPSGGKGTVSTAELAATVDKARDVVSWPFAGLTDEFKGSKGTVVWSSSLQRGYMRLTGVPVNTPTAAQYQLWIVDPARSKEPVDGGVFDVAGGEVVVPIDAKLAIGTPAAFAITREKPGGVVVSAGPLLMAAKP